MHLYNLTSFLFILSYHDTTSKGSHVREMLVRGAVEGIQKQQSLEPSNMLKHPDK